MIVIIQVITVKNSYDRSQFTIEARNINVQSIFMMPNLLIVFGHITVMKNR